VYDSIDFLNQRMNEKHSELIEDAELRRKLRIANVRIPTLQEQMLLRIGERMVSVGSKLKERYAMSSSNM
jgi:hypothetical protein